MTSDAVQARREYMRAYRERNREKINERQREWYKNNPEKVKKIRENYWKNKAAASNQATV